MKHTRAAGIALVVFALVGGTTAGCGSKEPGTTPTTAGTGAGAASSAPPAPKDTLLASVKSFDTTSYSFHITQDSLSGTGKVDPTAKAASISVSGKVSGQNISIGYTVVNSDLWVKVDLGSTVNKQLGVNKTKWMHIDQTKVTDKTQLPLDANGAISLGTNTMLGGMANVQRIDSTHFSGTVDVTSADSLLSPDKDLLTKVGDKAKAVPFTAAVDTQGRLTSLKVDGTSIDPGLSISVSFDDFGAAQAITKPTGAIEAPASIYSLFGGS